MTKAKARAASAAPPTVVEPKVRELSWLSPTFGTADGYGNSAEQMTLALERAGVTVTLCGITRKVGHLNASHIAERESIPGQAIVFYAPPTGWVKQHLNPRVPLRKAFGFSMYERNELPARWVQKIDEVDEVWTPSEHSASLFRRNTDKPVAIIPLGVDAEAFSYRKRERGEKLRFLFFATYANEVRKGLDIALRAFAAAFPDRDDVEMVIRSSFPVPIEKRDPRVRIEIGRLTTAELAKYYGTFDALLAPSRGEGFGLCNLEAMATGMPAIYTAAAGALDYADLGMPVGSREVVAPDGHGDAVRGPHRYGLWWEPDGDALVDRLRQVDRDYDGVMAGSARDAERIASLWTWDRTARAIIARLNA